MWRTELVTSFIEKDEQVLDVGGSAQPLARANKIIDELSDEDFWGQM